MKNKYPIIIEYSAEDEGYVARVPALKYCTAFGDTMEAAAREIEIAIDGVLAVAKESGKPIPAAGPSIEELQSVSNLVKLSELARLANIKEQTLFTKLRRRSPLSPEEASALAGALSLSGIQLVFSLAAGAVSAALPKNSKKRKVVRYTTGERKTTIRKRTPVHA